MSHILASNFQSGKNWLHEPLAPSTAHAANYMMDKGKKVMWSSIRMEILWFYLANQFQGKEHAEGLLLKRRRFNCFFTVCSLIISLLSYIRIYTTTTACDWSSKSNLVHDLLCHRKILPRTGSFAYKSFSSFLKCHLESARFSVKLHSSQTYSGVWKI